MHRTDGHQECRAAQGCRGKAFPRVHRPKLVKFPGAPPPDPRKVGLRPPRAPNRSQGKWVPKWDPKWAPQKKLVPKRDPKWAPNKNGSPNGPQTKMGHAQPGMGHAQPMGPNGPGSNNGPERPRVQQWARTAQGPVSLHMFSMLHFDSRIRISVQCGADVCGAIQSLLSFCHLIRP